jgi:hypothetical protein
MNTIRLLAPVALIAVLSAAGCSSARDVEVSGEVKAATSTAVQGNIHVEFFDVSGEGEDLELTSVHAVELTNVGEFNEKVPLEGDRVLVRAIADADGNGACSDGEAWAEMEAAIEEDAASVALELRIQACPAAE